MSDTPDILQRILARKAEEIAERQQRLSLQELHRREGISGIDEKRSRAAS